MEQMKRSEYRSIKFETRVEEKQEGGKKLVLRGYPILFNTDTSIYDYWYGEVRETIFSLKRKKAGKPSSKVK